MPRWIPRALLLLFAVAGPLAHAQTFDGSDLHRVADIADGAWLLRAGDDPQWARSDYDDSQWQTVSTEDDLKEVLQGQHPPVVWYRLHIKVNPADHYLALSQNNLASAFEVYTNGVMIMRAGSVVPHRGVTIAYMDSPIPPVQVASGTVVVAIRVGLTRADWSAPRPGLGAGNLLLGYELQLEDRHHYRVLVNHVAEWGNACLGVFVGLIALGLYLVERRRREYLWLFLYGLTWAAYLLLDALRSYHPLPLLEMDVATGVLLALPAITYLRFVWRALGHKAGRWIHIYQPLFLIGLPAFYVAFDLAWVHFGTLAVVSFLFFAPISVLLPIVAIRDYRRGNGEAGLLLVPLLLSGFASYLQYAAYFFAALGMHADRLDTVYNALNSMSIGTLEVSLDTATSVLALFAITLIIVLRTNRISLQLSRSAAELEAARGVQSLLLSRESMATPGFAVESVYQPAQEVGGDFFLVSPGEDGSLLVVVGDVSGKGLPAALRVSLILGALQREPSRRPGEVLAGLNRVLHAQSDGGFTTCGCALIAADGRLTLANAGHLSPYRSGAELALDGGLPLGIVADAAYSETELVLATGDSLVYLSDGVAEARNPKGELFGFERTQQISTRPAAEIASAAQQFGQDDDITVVRIARVALKPSYGQE